MQCPLTLVLARTLMVLNGGMVTFCLVQTKPLMSLSQNFCTSTVSPCWQEPVAPFVTLLCVWAATGELQWPWHDCPKVGLSQYHGSLCKLPCSHETRSFVDYLCAHHDQKCLGVDCGGDNQQQHILIIVSYPQNLAGLPPQIWEYGMAAPPIPSSSNNQPWGWMCRVSSLQNWALMLDTWVPESIKAVTSSPSYNYRGFIRVPY